MWNKLDPSLASMVAKYQRAPHADALLNVVVQFTGSVDELRSAGFRHIVATEPTRAFATLHLADVEQIAAHPNVLKLSYGREPKPMLDQSIADIRANQVWSQSGGVFTGTTGVGVIVAIIDTGIDWQHPFFRLNVPPNNTRIMRIWDMGLTPQGGESSPPLSRLNNGTGTYGVEYTEANINTALSGDAGTVRTRDCSGHGTHVASIAAGNGRPKFTYIGVAPEAGIIAVKLLDPLEQPRINGVTVPWIQRVKDAVTYVLQTVHDVYGDAPLVINCSFGSDTGPHDGFTDEEDFLTNTFDATPGKVLVVAAGNSGNKGQHAEIQMTAAGSTTIPIRLYDRRTKTTDHDLCGSDDLTGDLEFNLYYPAGSPAVTCEVDAPDDGQSFIAGPALGGGPVDIPYRSWTQTMSHNTDDQLLRGGVGTVHRCLFKMNFAVNGLKKHWTGDYQLKITTAGPLTLHLWVGQSFGYGLTIDQVNTPAEVVVDSDNRSLIGQPGGATNAITVASYRATEASTHDIAPTSSRGPLVRYDNFVLLPATPDKPDIAAPGIEIDAAQSRDIEGAKKKYKRTQQMGGTSMAAPHVTGAVALLLQRLGSSTPFQVKTYLRNNVNAARPTTPAEETGAGQLDIRQVFDVLP